MTKMLRMPTRVLDALHDLRDEIENLGYPEEDFEYGTPELLLTKDECDCLYSYLDEAAGYMQSWMVKENEKQP